MGLHVLLKCLLVILQGELLVAHWAHFPVTLHVLFKLALIVVGRKHHGAQRAFLLYCVPAEEPEEWIRPLSTTSNKELYIPYAHKKNDIAVQEKALPG